MPLGRAAGLLEPSQIQEGKQAGKDTVPQGWAGLRCPSPGAAGQTDMGMSETPRAKMQVRGGGAPSAPRGAESSGAPPAPGRVPRSALAPQPQLGRGAGGEEARGGLTAPAALSAPLLRST